MNPEIDHYLAEGCGRCKLYATPACKVHRWQKELKVLRQIILDCGLQEELKWSVPCYTRSNKNILVLAAFKEYCAISFFKGALLKDEKKLLIKAGENTQAGRMFQFTDVKTIVKLKPVIKNYIFEAVEAEKSGVKIVSKTVSDYPVPEEFKKALKKNAVLKKAFSSLTPGRQKAYLIYFGQAKQSKTRESRIEKSIPDILEGKGLYD